MDLNACERSEEMDRRSVRGCADSESEVESELESSSLLLSSDVVSSALAIRLKLLP